MEHITDIAGLSDDSISKTLQRIEETYTMDLMTESVGGYTYLLKLVDNDESVITTINQEFGKLGYRFNGNCDARIGSKNKNSIMNNLERPLIWQQYCLTSLNQKL